MSSPPHPHEPAPRDREPIDPDVTSAEAHQAATEHLSLRHLLRGRADIVGVVAAGGAIGALARWGLAELMPHGTGGFATSTLVANVVGAFLLGILMVVVIEVMHPTRLVRPFLGTGILGGFTTFSTYTLDVHEQLRAGHPAAAAAYLALTLVGGLAATALAIAVTRRLLVREEVTP
jgi:CrcB protein